CMQGMEFPLTF
nr:immunoglobulin light chain junction region [Macaca mulatta]MOW63744.1 immunoglobulin light chain junction region [Macaca mulatta]MOW64448.1 immunoglobulin light chain junction region [Macaca mulatta]MOW64628.1 immunoglobulin light chain junction region [Macaca mulatta]MOW64688.1 immunoglobulin light chain junction region [Macaca mulatta]